MKKYNRHFTLVEMLTVVAIIGILAGLIIPTVVISQKKGRVTQAKTDISSITTALKQLKTDYNRILLADGGINSDTKATVSDDIATISGDTYSALIAELSVPKNSGLGSETSKRINKRRKVYLDPKNGFDPTAKYTAAVNQEKLWLDPWGEKYKIYIKTKNTDVLAIPDTSKTIASEIAIYSYGPNGTDDRGCNVELESCIYSDDSSNHKNHDDIASWNL